MKSFRLKTPSKATENDIERGCLDLLALRGYWVTRQQSGLFKTIDGRWVRIGTKGLPDYVVLHRRYPGFLLEVKRPGRHLDPDQIQKINEIQIGYLLDVAVVDDVSVLHHWLIEHEGKAERLWRQTTK